MKKRRIVVTRRDFIRGTAGAALGAALLGPAWLRAEAAQGGRSMVVIVRDPKVLDAEMNVNHKVMDAMLEQVLVQVTGKADAKAAWLSLVKPTDVIGLVPTPLMNPTHPELIDSVKASLAAAGIPVERIVPAQGRSVDLEPITALVCMPGLKAHWLTGIGTVIKNYILYSGAPRNYHHQDSVKLGEIWNLPQVKGKTRLVLVDALRPVCDKGPQFDPRYRWAYGGLIAGLDPVAVDAVGLKIIEAKRQELRGEPWPLSPPPICVEAADKVYKLGNSDAARIDIKAFGWKENLLV
ncbi:MAG: DUF362 domain-containing protein [Candidatus Aminicenantes bacterium]|nr:DUF362 domain-containing protein [Candidatus Aminicenantes bacterium]